MRLGRARKSVNHRLRRCAQIDRPGSWRRAGGTTEAVTNGTPARHRTWIYRRELAIAAADIRMSWRTMNSPRFNSLYSFQSICAIRVICGRVIHGGDRYVIRNGSGNVAALLLVLGGPGGFAGILNPIHVRRGVSGLDLRLRGLRGGVESCFPRRPRTRLAGAGFQTNGGRAP